MDRQSSDWGKADPLQDKFRPGRKSASSPASELFADESLQDETNGGIIGLGGRDRGLTPLELEEVHVHTRRETDANDGLEFVPDPASLEEAEAAAAAATAGPEILEAGEWECVHCKCCPSCIRAVCCCFGLPCSCCCRTRGRRKGTCCFLFFMLVVLAVVAAIGYSAEPKFWVTPPSVSVKSINMRSFSLTPIPPSLNVVLDLKIAIKNTLGIGVKVAWAKADVFYVGPRSTGGGLGRLTSGAVNVGGGLANDPPKISAESTTEIDIVLTLTYSFFANPTVLNEIQADCGFAQNPTIPVELDVWGEVETGIPWFNVGIPKIRVAGISVPCS